MTSCKPDPADQGAVQQTRSFPVWEWSTPLAGTWDVDAIALSGGISFSRNENLLRLVLPGKGDSQSQLFFIKMGSDGQLRSSDSRPVPAFPDTPRIIQSGADVYAYSGPEYEKLLDPAYNAPSFLYRISLLDTLGQKAEQVKLPKGSSLINFDGQTATVADPKDIRKLLSGEEVMCSYAYAGMKDLTEWQSFRSTALIREISEGPISHWLTGVYYGTLLIDGDTILPAPAEQIVGFIASRDLFGETKWARQLGGVRPGEPRKWSSTRTLDLLPDPAGYAWVLWEGKPINQSGTKSFLGVSFYDPSGIRMKNFLFEVQLPQGAYPQLQAAGNELFAITSEGLAPSGDPLRHILLFDRDGGIVQDTVLYFSEGEKCLKGVLDERNFYYLAMKMPDTSDTLPQTELFIRKKRFR